MAFTKSTENGFLKAVEVVTLGNATTVYSSVLDTLRVRRRFAQNVFTVTLQASAVSGTNVDISLYGSDTEAGTVKRLVTANIVTALTDTTEAVAYIDVGAKPWPYYFLSFLSDADETANTVTVTILAPPLEG